MTNGQDQTFLKVVVKEVRQAAIWKSSVSYVVVFKAFKTQIANDYWTDSEDDAEKVAQKYVNEGRIPGE